MTFVVVTTALVVVLVVTAASVAAAEAVVLVSVAVEEVAPFASAGFGAALAPSVEVVGASGESVEPSKIEQTFVSVPDSGPALDTDNDPELETEPDNDTGPTFGSN